jgi:hypothetical protein
VRQVFDDGRMTASPMLLDTGKRIDQTRHRVPLSNNNTLQAEGGIMQKEQLKGSNFPRGSEWRRWDLHVHTPESKLGTAFVGVGWGQYLDALEMVAKKEEVAVIGVTDYMSIDGYEKLLIEHRQNKRLTTVNLLIPNIEFRSQPATKDGKGLNIHLLVDPSDPEHVAKIKRALSNLRTKYKELPYGCSRAELVEFGRAQDASVPDDEAAYRLGIEQFKPTYTELRAWLGDEGWLRTNCLIGIANGKDGVSGLPLDGFSVVREELLEMCHFVFSGNPADRAHYLGQKDKFPPEKIKELYGNLKPCLHGSDAHDIAHLFKPDEDRYCWIKADPTFEGLRQVLWEPAARVQISAVKPQLSDLSRVMTELVIGKNAGWFTQKSIPLSGGLVAVIGEKGSGKTAIADLVAFAAGEPMDSASQSSFVTKGRLHLQAVPIQLDWGAGAPTKGVLTDAPHAVQRPLVRYLSQDFVERLCSDDHQGHELQQAIEEVVFSHLDEVHREGFSSFPELRASREAASQTRQDEFRGQLASSHREIERLYSALAQRASKAALKAQSEAQLTELNKQLPSVQVLADQTILQQLQLEQANLTAIEKSIAEISRRRRTIDDLHKSYSAYKDRADRQLLELLGSAVTNAVPQALLDRLSPKWDRSVEAELIAMVSGLDKEILSLRGTELAANQKGISLADTAHRIKVLQESLSKDETNRKRLLDLQKQIAAQEATIQRLTNEIDDLTNKTTKQVTQREVEREGLYLKFFSNLGEDEKGLQELYAPMKSELAALGNEMKFELSSGYRIDVGEWLRKADRFYDGRRPAALAKKDEIEKYVTESLVPAWKSGDQQSIRNAFRGFVRIVSPIDFMEKLAAPSVKMVDLFDWMFSTDHVGTTYKVRYGGTELEYLSPGTRGIALLVLYLLMDEDDRRPLIVDQPEGNLDNSSIYQQLVPYIRRAKEKRQIILITHNPNLVVAADAEQVIVATAERPAMQTYPRITYTAGSLEHSHPGKVLGTRQAVCMLLEGGEQAFKEREGRYSI